MRARFSRWRSATLANSHPEAKRWLIEKLRQRPSDWESRNFLTVPGVVWSVESDTCMTGRLSAPDNVAYDEWGGEFVFRQPSDEAQLAAIMSADSEEVFSCYRFDGLERWTVSAVGAWASRRHVILGWVSHLLATEADSEVTDSLRRYQEFLSSPDFRTYIVGLEKALTRDTRRSVLGMRRR